MTKKWINPNAINYKYSPERPVEINVRKLNFIPKFNSYTNAKSGTIHLYMFLVVTTEDWVGGPNLHMVHKGLYPRARVDQ